MDEIIKIDLKDLVQLKKNLNEVSRGAYPLAVRSTLNRMAYEAAIKAKEEVLPREFTLRNTYIQPTVRFQSCATTFNIAQMESFVGQIDKYAGKKTDQLQKQEYGLPVISKGKYTKVPTPSARSGSYAKKVAPSKLIGKLNLQKLDQLVANPTKDKTKEIKQASAFSRKHKKSFNVLLTNPKGRKGIYQIDSGKVRLLYSFKKRITIIKRTKWLQPTAISINNNVDKYFIQEGASRIEKALANRLKA